MTVYFCHYFCSYINIWRERSQLWRRQIVVPSQNTYFSKPGCSQVLLVHGRALSPHISILQASGWFRCHCHVSMSLSLSCVIFFFWWTTLVEDYFVYSDQLWKLTDCNPQVCWQSYDIHNQCYQKVAWTSGQSSTGCRWDWAIRYLVTSLSYECNPSSVSWPNFNNLCTKMNINWMVS